MIRRVVVALLLLSPIFWSTPLWSQEKIGRLYKNTESTSSWWNRVNNQNDWLRQRLGTKYTFERSIGVIIAISDYAGTSDFKDLASPSGDALRMKDFLLNEAGFDRVHLLVDDDASSINIRKLMERVIPSVVSENDRLLVYWSGHGGSAKDSLGRDYGFLALQNATEDGRIDSIHMDDTRRWLRRTNARQVLYVCDTCYSGLALQTASSPTEPVWEQLAGPSQFMLTSSSSTQESYGHTDGSGGLFTTAFLEGARGAADTNGDGLATITEIAAHLETRLTTGLGFVQSSQYGSIGRQEGRFFFLSGKDPTPISEIDPRAVEPSGGRCGAASADYNNFVRDTLACEDVDVFLDTHANSAECMAYRLATRHKQAMCSTVTQEPVVALDSRGTEDAAINSRTDIASSLKIENSVESIGGMSLEALGIRTQKGGNTRPLFHASPTYIARKALGIYTSQHYNKHYTTKDPTGIRLLSHEVRLTGIALRSLDSDEPYVSAQALQFLRAYTGQFNDVLEIQIRHSTGMNQADSFGMNKQIGRVEIIQEFLETAFPELKVTIVELSDDLPRVEEYTTNPTIEVLIVFDYM